MLDLWIEVCVCDAQAVQSLAVSLVVAEVGASGAGVAAVEDVSGSAVQVSV
jgi:hypothetical protein